MEENPRLGRRRHNNNTLERQTDIDACNWDVCALKTRLFAMD